MKRIYFLPFVLLMTISALKAQTPIQMNDDLAGITDSLFAKGQKWGVTFNEAYKSGDYSILKPQSSGMLVFINAKITYVTNLKDVKNSKPMRMAMLDLLTFEKQMITGDFLVFETFDANTPKEKIQAALNSLTEKSKEEGTYLKKVGAAQEAYATENGFTIEGAKKD